MMRSLKEAIELCKLRLSNPDMTHASRERERVHLHYHEVLQELFPDPAKEIMPDPIEDIGQEIIQPTTPKTKYCYLYNERVVEQCSICEVCPTTGGLAWNEADE